MSNYFFNKQKQELDRIDNMLSRFQDAGPNPDPDKLDLAHVMLLEERKKVASRMESEAKMAGIDFSNTNRNNIFNQNDQGEEEQSDDNQVSEAERQRACTALEPNGCGAKGDTISAIIPNKPLGFDFTDACNNHDRNFGTLGVTFSEANNQFYIDMVSAVKAIAKPGTIFYNSGINLAKFYFDKVEKHGMSKYEEAQNNAYICKFGRSPD